MTIAAPPKAASAGPAGASGPSFFVAGGTLRADAECYAARAADRDLLSALRQGEFCYVLTSRQMGKSSLMVRTAAQLREEGVVVVILDLTAIGQNLDAEQWYFSLLSHIGEKLEMEDAIEAYWDEHARQPPLARWTGALREVVLAQVHSPIVIFIDEIDYVRSLSFSTDEFFAGIRECFNRRTQDVALRGLTVCLLGVATPSDLIRDQRLTPFNIGRGVELADFTKSEAEVFARGLHPIPAVATVLRDRIVHWTGGHPYLTQKLCAEAVKGGAVTAQQVDEVCGRIFLAPHARERDDNLHFVRERVLQSNCDRAALLDTYAKVCRRQRVVDDDTNPLINELRLAGIVRVAGQVLRVRNEIYARVFDLRWARENLPDAEQRRQRAAFYRGVQRVTGASIAAIAVMAAMAFYAVSQKHKAERLLRAREQAVQDAKANEQKAQASERQANVHSKLAQEKGEQLLRTRQQIAANLTATQDNVVALLEALAPVLREANPEKRKTVLESVQALHQGAASGEGAELPAVQVGQQKLSNAYYQLYRMIDDTEAAVRHARETHQRLAVRAKEQPEDLELQRQLVQSYTTIANTILTMRSAESEGKAGAELEPALSAQRDGLALAEKLAREHAGDRQWKHLVFVAQNRLGDIHTRLGHYPEALEAYDAARRGVEEMRAAAPDDPQLGESVAQSHDRRGDFLLLQNNFKGARDEFKKALDLREGYRRQLTTLADMPDAESAVAVSYNKLGKALSYLGQTREALASYERSFAEREKLARDHPLNSDWQRNLAISCNNVASLLREGTPAERERARKLYKERIEIMQKLHEKDVTQPDWRHDYSHALNNYANFLLNFAEKSASGWKEALKLAETAADLSGRSDPSILEILGHAQRLNGQVLEGRQTIETALALLPPEAERSRQQQALHKALGQELEISQRTPVEKGNREPSPTSRRSKGRRD